MPTDVLFMQLNLMLAFRELWMRDRLSVLFSSDWEDREDVNNTGGRVFCSMRSPLRAINLRGSLLLERMQETEKAEIAVAVRSHQPSFIE